MNRGDILQYMQHIYRYSPVEVASGVTGGRVQIASMDIIYPLLFEDLGKFTFTTSLCYTATACRLQAEARDRLAHRDDRLTVAKWQMQTTKLATGNNTLPEVRSLFCTVKFICQYFLGLGVIVSCI